MKLRLSQSLHEMWRVKIQCKCWVSFECNLTGNAIELRIKHGIDEIVHKDLFDYVVKGDTTEEFVEKFQQIIEGDNFLIPRPVD